MAAGHEERPLFHAVPGLPDRVPWLPLASLPTPLQRHELTVSRGARSVLIKRDDLSARPYGGNKVRKLEFVLAAARSRGAGRLITAGAAGSHHALATAIYGSAAGFGVSLVLFPQRVTDHVRRVLLLDHAYGAELRWTRRMEGVPFAVVRARLAHRASGPYVVAPGGSDAIGTLGYVNAGLELAAQLDEVSDAVSVVYVAAGTLGTTAGLALGLAIAGRSVRIEAVRITGKLVTNEGALRRLIGRTAKLLSEAGADVPPVARVVDSIRLRDDHLGSGYGRATEAADAATQVFSRVGLTLDPTYTAKAAAALLADDPPDDGLPLFLHTLSAAEPTDRLAGVDASQLPEPFARYLGESRSGNA